MRQTFLLHALGYLLLWSMRFVASIVTAGVLLVLGLVVLAPCLPALVFHWVLRVGEFFFSRERRWRDLGTIALRVGHYALAERCARKLLAQADRPFSPRPRADERHHDGHLLLGLAALGRGEIERAGQHLSSSAQVIPGARLLVSGPDLQLARELLDRGERDRVAEYLERCERAWSSGPSELARLAGALRAGETVRLPKRATALPSATHPLAAGAPRAG